MAGTGKARTLDVFPIFVGAVAITLVLAAALNVLYAGRTWLVPWWLWAGC